VSIDRIFRCDWKECDGHVLTARTCPSGSGFLTITEHSVGAEDLHFCSWDCVLRFAAAIEPIETVSLGD